MTDALRCVQHTSRPIGPVSCFVPPPATIRHPDENGPAYRDVSRARRVTESCMHDSQIQRDQNWRLSTSSWVTFCQNLAIPVSLFPSFGQLKKSMCESGATLADCSAILQESGDFFARASGHAGLCPFDRSPSSSSRPSECFRCRNVSAQCERASGGKHRRVPRS